MAYIIYLRLVFLTTSKQPVQQRTGEYPSPAFCMSSCDSGLETAWSVGCNTEGIGDEYLREGYVGLSS